MELMKEMQVSMSETQQQMLLERLMKSGQAFDFPTSKLLLDTMRFCGLDLDVLKSFLTNPAHADIRVMEILRKLSTHFEKFASDAEACGDVETAKKRYLNAIISCVFANWLSYDYNDTKINYEMMLPCCDKFRMLSTPPIEKLVFPCYKGSVFAYLSFPDPAKFILPYPVILIVQGNDEVKEMNVPFEKMAHERGFAVLNIDPPGWGESYLSGNVFKNVDVYKSAIVNAINYVEKRPELERERIASFGVSFGGLLTHFAAGLDHRIKASAGMGAPFMDNRKMREGLPDAQKKRTYLLTGTNSENELMAWSEQFDVIRHLKDVLHPALIVHGQEDNLVPAENAQAIADCITGKTTVKVIPGGDHMCMHSLESTVGPMMFDWLKEQLDM